MRRPIRAPALTDARRASVLTGAWLLFSALYLAPHHLSPMAATSLERGALDLAFPLWPWSILIYLSQFPLLGLGLWRAEPRTRGVTLARMLLAAGLASTIFVVFPTTLARADPSGFGLWEPLWRFLFLADVPSNCLPSLHAALALLAWPAWRHPGPDRRVLPAPLLALWLALIFVSTLTTRQHLLLDLLAGSALAGVVALLVGGVEDGDEAAAA